ncbi:hypothetical protein TNCT_477121 [Trichonephila clavata]|uniref:Uncharacterized protein n=1 Tax=Trichonephila clavata TaxID=2740835 RepID=A0A8X6L6X5_TRICU|nr:hypothetical protein TNCT_477121 [Trichonephila clavata]
MDDNARIYRARVVSLEAIDDDRNMLRRRLSILCNPPQNLNGLTTCLLKWTQIPQSRIEGLLGGMNLRCRVCISSRSGHSSY